MLFSLRALLVSVFGLINSHRVAPQVDSFLSVGSKESAEVPKKTRGSAKAKFSDPACEIGEPTQTGILSSAVEESSGLSCSLTYEGVCYTHNDSQDKARIFAVDTTGKLLAEIRLKGVWARDWEDIAIAGDYLYIGDIGDNGARKTRKSIIKMKEVDVRNVEPGTVIEVEAETFVFDMPADAGGQNAESMFCDPTDGGRTLYIITKKPDKGEKGSSKGKLIIKVTWGESDSAEYVGELWNGVRSKVTGAEMSPDGSLVAVRTYTYIYLWKVSAKTPEKAMGKRPCGERFFKEKQSEAIGFSGDGSKLYTTSEGVNLPMWSYSVGGSSSSGRLSSSGKGSGGRGKKMLDNSPGKDGRGKPLRECQGDCDKDSDCKGKLKCFQRDGNTPVPGCSGKGIANFDYCYKKR